VQNKGIVYILTNESYLPDLLKIGYTQRSADCRAYELYDKATGVPGKFKVAHEREVIDCKTAEEVIHIRLAKYRQNEYREFFKIDIDLAKEAVDQVVSEIERLYQPSPEPEPTTLSTHRFKARDKTRRQESSANPRDSYKSSTNLLAQCRYCWQEFKVTLIRYESQATCPSCKRMTSVPVSW